MPSPSVIGVPHAEGHVHIVHILVPGATPLLVHGGDGVVTSQELVSPDPPRRKEVILTLDSCLRARGNSLEHPPLNVGPPLGHRDGDGKLLPSGLDKSQIRPAISTSRSCCLGLGRHYVIFRADFLFT